MSNTKICSQCGCEKPVEEFSKAYKNICKECRNENARSIRGKRIYIQEIDWETRRYEIAKEYLVRNAMESASPEEAAKMAVNAADYLINRLRS